MNTEVKASALLFAALGDETRLALVSRLSRGGPASIATLTGGSDLTRQAIAKHLGVMERARLIRRERRGRESVCRLDAERLAQARRSLEAISRQWAASLARLKAFVEE